MDGKKDTITFKFDGANISTDALGSSSLPLADYAPEDMGEWIKKNGSAIGIEAFKGVNLADFIAEQRI